MLMLKRAQIHFAKLRQAPLACFEEICQALEVEVSRSGAQYARSFPAHWVMATTATCRASHARWRLSPHTSEILCVAASHSLTELSFKLGLGAQGDSSGSVLCESV
jgi:hypothetical protein